MKIINLILILSLLTVEAYRERRNLLDNFASSSGFKIPGISNKIADLVSQAFTTHKNNEMGYKNRQDTVMLGNNDEQPIAENTFVSGLLKLLGLDGSKIGALALNGIVFIAQMLGQMLTPKEQQQSANRKQDFQDDNQSKFNDIDYDPFTLMINGIKNENIWTEVRDKNLPMNLISTIKETNSTTNTDCILMMICKLTPFMWGMQSAIMDRIEGSLERKNEEKLSKTSAIDNLAIFFHYLPSFEEFKKSSVKCEKSYGNCQLF